MKNMKKLLLTMVAMLTLVFALQISANAAVQFKGCTENSFTISWDKSTRSNVWGYRIKDRSDNVLKELSGANTLTYTFPNLSSGINETVWVYAIYWNGRTWAEDYEGYCYANTLPSTIAAKSFTTSIDTKAKEITVRANTQADGFQAEVINLATKGKRILTSQQYYTYVKAAAAVDTAFSVRVRPYIKNKSNNVVYYGAWSTKTYEVGTTSKLQSTNRTSGISVVLKRAKAVKSFTVYISPYDSKGFKKVGTYAFSTKTKTVPIKKYGSKTLTPWKTYYVKIIPNVKVGGSTVKAGASIGHIYPYK